MQMSAAELARLVSGALEGEAGIMLHGAEVDSRLIGRGDLFVALPGERCDGHDFVPAALAAGGAALVRADRELAAPPPGCALIRVAEPLAAYHALAAAERAQRSWRVAAITGSVGKTTTKDFLARLLVPLGVVGWTRGNRNSIYGLPAQVLAQADDVELFVAEAGMSRPGELELLSAILRPELVLYTRIAPAHTEFFSGIDAIVEAKAALLTHLDEDGQLVLNADDPRQADFADRTRARVVRYSAVPTAGPAPEVRLEAVEDRGLLGSRATLVLGASRAPIELRLPGRHQLENLVAAAAAAWALGVNVEQIAAGTAALEAAEHRGRLHHLDGGVTVVDDSYNASPVAMERLLDLLATAIGPTSGGRRIAVLGEMYELGELTSEAHRAVGQRSARSCDLLVAVGGEPAAVLAAEARAGGLAAAAVHHVDDAAAASSLVLSLLRPGDVVLVKGSRGVGLEQVVETLCGSERQRDELQEEDC